MFQNLDNEVNFPAQEESTLEFWKSNDIYQRSLDKRSNGENFVFYEGPPTANGLPHPGHCLTRAIKDLFPRYRTMRGYRCERKAGWDTHGLPVEVEVCKELGIHSKEEIEEYGVEPFIQKCQQSVWRYMQEWEKLTERLGFWIKLDEAYVTYHQSYVESVWWSLKNLFDRGLLYQGHKIVWWWAQGGTALSAGEVGQGYREVADPSVFVLFPLVDMEKTSLLVWTTTPWTLPSNQFAAVNPKIEYSIVFDEQLDRQIVLASDLVDEVSKKVKRELQVVSTCAGADLVGKRYRPPFGYYYDAMGDQTGTLGEGGEQHVAWRIIEADFVTTDSGTGAVHEAPAFGEVDYDVLIREQQRFVAGEGPEMICAVGPNGKFSAETPDLEGKWVKDADREIVRNLKESGALYHREQYLHEYPFCWRADQDPLIQYPRRSWFIRTTEFRDKMLANNSRINWLPGHIRDGRFGNFLESNVDWALSRERYWGTPLPIWVCEQTGQMEAVSSYEELLAKPGVSGTSVWEEAKAANPDLPDDLRVHKPYIDHVVYESPFHAGAMMRRVSEVIDCWYDSGAMPFAQWGFPHQNRDSFVDQFPANFISEALDQTRGWFYSLLAISTLLFSDDDAGEFQTEYPHPYENCIVLGLMLAEWWETRDGSQRFLSEEEAKAECGKDFVRKVGKMSKQLRNYRSPQEIFDRYGADALRWYFFANQPPWNSIIYSERAIRESIPEFLLRMWNVFSFFVLYANSDEFEPESRIDGPVGQLDPEQLARGDGYRPVEQRSELDRWVLSELNIAVEQVTTAMDQYDNYSACTEISNFLDALSNWYVRRSRQRYWSDDKAAPDKIDAHWTLYECLLTTARLVAPFVPFVAESMWRNLAGVFGERAETSVHLCDYPVADSSAIDRKLATQMGLLREIASLGRSARMQASLRVRQPLSGVTVVLSDPVHQSWLRQHDEILKDELNVKQISYTTDAAELVNYQVQPNFKRLGPRVGKLMPAVKKTLVEADGSELLAQLTDSGTVSLEIDGQQIELDNDDIEVRLQARDGMSAAQGSNSVVVLSTDLTPELTREGYARDLTRTVNELRKELDLEFTDRIQLNVYTNEDELRTAIEENREFVCRETLCVDLQMDNEKINEVYSEKQIGEFSVEILIKVVTVGAH